jgi:hypothetical protein
LFPTPARRFDGAAIVAVDCSSNILVAIGDDLVTNGDEDCPCFGDPIATEEPTWGRVKALYR